MIFLRLWCIVVDWNNEKLDENRLSKHVKSNESPIIIALSVAYRYSIKTRLIIFSKTKVNLSNLNDSCATNKNLRHLKTTSVQPSFKIVDHVLLLHRFCQLLDHDFQFSNIFSVISMKLIKNLHLTEYLQKFTVSFVFWN